jgi:hypothetical protein
VASDWPKNKEKSEKKYFLLLFLNFLQSFLLFFTVFLCKKAVSKNKKLFQWYQRLESFRASVTNFAQPSSILFLIIIGPTRDTGSYIKKCSQMLVVGATAAAAAKMTSFLPNH